MTLKVLLNERIYGAFVNLSISIPKTEEDESYGWEYFKTRVDIKKVVNGARDNFLASLIIGSLMSKSNIPVRFPVEKVIYTIYFLSLTFYFSIFFSNKAYFEISNVTIPGSLLMAKSKFFVKTSMDVKTNKKKKLTLAGSGDFYGKLNL